MDKLLTINLIFRKEKPFYILQHRGGFQLNSRSAINLMLEHQVTKDRRFSDRLDIHLKG